MGSLDRRWDSTLAREASLIEYAEETVSDRQRSESIHRETRARTESNRQPLSSKFAAVTAPSHDPYESTRATLGAVPAFANLAHAIGEYKRLSFQHALILAWFSVEQWLRRMWDAYVDALAESEVAGHKRVNSDRRKKLRGRDFTVSVVSEALELAGRLPTELFRRIDDARAWRNTAVHANDSASPQRASETIELAFDLLSLDFGFRPQCNQGYGISS